MLVSYECESFCDHRWKRSDYKQVCDYARYIFGDIGCPKCGHRKTVWKTLTKEEQAHLKKDAIVMQEMYHEAQQQLWEIKQAKKQKLKSKKRKLRKYPNLK